MRYVHICSHSPSNQLLIFALKHDDEPSRPHILPVARVFTSRASTDSRRPLISATLGSRPNASPLWRYLHEEERPPTTMSPDLADRLQDAQIEWPPGQNSYFIPVDRLYDLVSEREVKRELRKIHPSLDELRILSYTSSICRTSRKLFALLICCKKGSYICEFLDEGITDQDLPFLRAYRKADSGHYTQAQEFDLCTKDHIHCQREIHRDCGIKPMISWTQREVRILCRDQWLVLAPLFRKTSGKIPHVDLDENTILPFIEDQELRQDSRKGGGYSHVWGVRIHSAHQNVYKSTDPEVLRSCLRHSALTDTL
jgi:hypothetical protein